MIFVFYYMFDSYLEVLKINLGIMDLVKNLSSGSLICVKNDLTSEKQWRA